MRKNILISLLTLLLLNVQLLASGVDWTVNVHNYQYDMTAYVTLRLNGADVADLSSYTIAAFCNDECRGVMEARSVDNNTYGYLRIRSNQFSGEIITFKVYDPVSDRIAISTNQITFQSQQVIGYPSSPFVVEAMFQNWEPEFITICYGDSFAWDKSGKTYTESGVYTTIYDNAQATLHLTVLPEVPTTTEYATICHGETYTWNGQTYSTEGEYSVTLQNALGCDSIVTLHLTVNQTKHAEEHITACDSYTWNGQTYTQSGDYIYTTTAANGCDSIVTLHLTINQTQYAEVTATACDSYTWNGETYTESGEYVYTITAANGCDSIVTLHLTINATKYAEESITACDSYTWNGETYTQSGDYVYTTTATNGCDSIVTLHLTINQTKHAEKSVTACDSYEWNGEIYTESGEYVYTTTAANGCDSIVTLHLTINATKYAEEIITACDSYTWNGETYTQSGEYVYTTTASNGCDSIVTLHLTINQTKHAEKSVTACDSYEWNGEIYTESGDYVYTTTATNGCDSIVTLHLTINNSEIGETEYVTICHGETYTWNGQTYSTEGEYSVTLQNAFGCDSVASLHLTILPAAITTAETVVIGSDELPYVWRGNTYTATGRYTDVEHYATIACDSAIHVLDLTVLNTDNYDEQSVTICETEAPYTWYGESYTATGKYAYTEKYVGTDIDSIQHILNLTVNPTVYTEEIITACDSYTWNGQTYTESGDYVYTTVAANGCDSIVTLHLTINNTQYAEESVVACDSYTWNGETYTESGDYVYTTIASNGCDSIVTLHLTINQTKHAEESITACDSYTWNGETYTQSGDYVYTTTATNGCDSIVTLHLTINQTKHAEEIITACDSHIWNGETYTQSGDYVYTTTATNGCDSIVTLHLTINQTKHAEEIITACDSYTWNGQTYTQSGEYVYTTTAANGCDSIVTLHLTINPTKYTEETITACDSYTWNGQTYTESGDYVYTTVAANGCDSIVTLHLTINQTQYAEKSVTACNSYEWNGEIYTESGDYVYTTTAANGCDSIVTLHLTINNSEVAVPEYVTICHGETYTWNGQTYSTEGEYSVTLQNAFGCDSIATLHLTILPAAITTTEIVVVGSDELPYTWRGNTYSATGRYTVVEQYTTVACDSAIYVLDLTVLTTGNHDEQSVTICETEAPYQWYGESYSATGKYTYTEKYVGTDIDSIQHILNLTVNPTVYTEEIITACDSYAWNGETYTESGDYVYTTTATNGCDSIVTLHLTVNQTKHAEEHITACDSYTWNGETYTESGEYVYTTTAANGCDSIITLRLTINQTKHTEETAVACDSYEWNGEIYTESGDYVYTTIASNGCDSIVTLHLTINRSEVAVPEYATICHGETYTWNAQTYSTEGEYSITLSNTLGCDSVATLHLTIMPEAVTTTETVVIGSDELPYTWRGNTYSATGRYTDIEQYATIACDSAIYVLDLTVLATSNYDEQSVTICDSEAPYLWYGESYSATGKYTYTEKYVGTDIDSVQHILNLTVNPIVYAEETITACDSYTWNGETYTESGEYVYTTTAANDCDSIVTLHLTINNTQYAEESVVACDSYAWNGETYTESGDYVYTTTAANGCDSIVTLHLTINQTQYAEESVVACDRYTWNGETYTQSGEYTYTTVAANGCDSIVTLHLTINNSEIGEIEYAIICYGETYTWNGQTYSTEGEYSITLSNTLGCDSVATLHLTIMPAAVTTTETVVIGSDELPYTWRGNTYSVTGRYTDIEQYATIACDSVIHVLDLTVLTTGNHDEQSVTICETEAPYQWYGESYSATGKYTYTEKYVGTDIDSIQHILNLTVNPTVYTEEHITACDSYEWNGETYTTSGDYVYTTTAANGCDSIVTLHLTINNTQYAEESVVACDSYTWNGETYTQSGEYVYTTTAANGCDSIVTLHLTVNQTKHTEEHITACDSYTWNGEIYTESGDYVYTTTAANGCDSIVTLHLTINQTKYAEESITACDSYEWNGETYTTSGEYVYTTIASNGCDSIVTLHLTINQTQYAAVTATACDSYTWNGQTYTQSGDYVYTTTAANGCDSTVTLHLTINYSEVAATEYTTICHGETYIWNGIAYAESGEYSITLQNALGCDSVAILHLTIMPAAITTTETVVIGNDEIPYTWRGTTYTATGRYTDVEHYATVACDSVIHVLDLTVLNTDNYDEQSVTICETEVPYLWYGESYSTTGKYTYIEKYVGTDIDSIQHILNLTVNPTVYTEEHITACDSYTWNGETYTTSGDYVYTTTAANGCDSIVTLHLTINQTQYAEKSVTACDSYEWNGEIYTESGDYVYTAIASNGCDRVEVLHLTILEAITETEILALCPSELPYEWYGQSLTEAGLYTATEQYSGMSCDSIIHELTLNIFVQTLPDQLTLPIVQPGKPIDVTIPTEEILAYIAAQTWYAPNAWVVWYVKDGAEWGPLTTEPVSSAASNVVLKYAVETDCDIIESTAMTIIIEPTSVDLIQSVEKSTHKIISNDKVWIIRNGEMYNIVGVKVTEVR